MKPIILIALIIRAMEALKIFDAAWLMTQGGPGDATTTMSVYLYSETFIGTRWGYTSAVAILMLIMVSMIAMRAIRPIEAASQESFEELVTPRRRCRSCRSKRRSRRRRGRDDRDGSWLRSIAEGDRRLVLGVVFLFPLYWIVTMAFKPQEEWQPVDGVHWVPQDWTLENFKKIFGRATDTGFFEAAPTDATNSIVNSIVAATGGTLLAMLVGMLTAYGIARYRAGGRFLPVPDPAAADVPADRDRDPAADHVLVPPPRRHVLGPDPDLRGGHLPVRRSG